MFHIIESLMYLDGMVKCKYNINLIGDIREFTALLESDKL